MTRGSEIAVVAIRPTGRLLRHRGQGGQLADSASRDVEDDVVRAAGEPQHRVVLRRRHEVAVGADQVAVEALDLRRIIGNDRAPELGAEPGHQVDPSHGGTGLSQCVLRGQGVDEVYCFSVNDAFVMYQWGRKLGIERAQLFFDLPDIGG